VRYTEARVFNEELDFASSLVAIGIAGQKPMIRHRDRKNRTMSEKKDHN